MLKLTHVHKDYKIGETVTHALIDINLDFPDQQFVSILGQSGSGKTTLLNLIGGLDHYTSGDLFINGMSTKEFKDSDWDAYRNGTIGFVFQSYNLIPHLTVLDNVEIALTLSGVSVAERRERAKKVLAEVGIEDQMYKRPNTLSGGQMQRVAIARALVNNPKIVLADEPTGAIDSKTSIQIMELIKKISKDRLVIMVTHNEQLAVAYSDRIIRLLDGKVVEDDAPYQEVLDAKRPIAHKNKKTSMSFLTALKSSFKNLISKKTRTIITSVAGSIGIIGIALVLSISAGMTSYVNSMQSDTLAGFPLTISPIVNVSSDRFNPQQRMSEATGQLIDADAFPTTEILFSYDSEADIDAHTNNISQTYLDYINGMDSNLYNSISYSRGIKMNVVAQNASGAYQLVNTSQASGLMALFGGNGYFNEIPNSREFIETQYDLLGSESRYPVAANEIVLIVDSKNRVNVSLLEDFGIAVEDEYSFGDFIGKSFYVIGNNDFYHQVGNLFLAGTDYETMTSSADVQTITIVGIMRVKESASSELLSTGIGYTTMLTDHILADAQTSDIVVAQEASPTVNVLSGTPFNSTITYDAVIQLIGGDTMPTGIQIYPVSFDAKAEIKTYLDGFNTGKAADDMILYSDLAETISGTISSLISTITVILSAFAAISLVVSSIMIGIITYVSVVERTKEIGIMRSIGARKKDIGRIFNAETVLIGFAAGVIGILSTLILIIPINLWIGKLTAISGFARLPILSGLGLIVISIALTFIAGLVPSGIAARRDPVVALRTE